MAWPSGWPSQPILNSGFTTLGIGRAAFTASEPDKAPTGMNCGQNRIERLMLTMTGAGLQIETIHARAICDEIGERLRTVLRRDVGDDLPPRLRYLMEQLAKADDEASPSIVPSLDEMLMPLGHDPEKCVAISRKDHAQRPKAR
jgi:hypothetical protein